jgi:hypothetical protein
MEVVGGMERPETDGSSDAFGWFTPEELGTISIGDLVDRVMRAETLA